MAVKEKITQEDLILYEILKNPVLFAEFVNNVDQGPYDEEFELSIYQKEIACDFNNYVSICASRACGKTVTITNVIVWSMVFNLYKGDYIVYLVPGKSHLEPVFNNLVRMLRTISFLKEFISASSGINRSENSIKLLNGSLLICRIAGQSGTGVSVVGLHTPAVFLDESAYFPYSAWIELQPIVNNFTPGYKLWVSGVPDGRREKSVCYHCDQENTAYSKHRINAFMNPRFTQRDKELAIELYGGEDSDEYMHMVLGLHGKPVFSLFDRSMFEIDNYPVYKMVINGIELQDDLAEYIARLSVFPGMQDNKKTIIGIDLGYTEPTAILIMYLDRGDRIKFHGKIQLNKVSYPIQEKLIDYLDSKFNPMLIGIDKGSTGISTIQKLSEGVEFLHKNYKNRIVPVDFSSWLVIGIKSDGDELKQKTKPFATSILQEYSNNHKIVYSHTDLDLISELERMTYTKTPNGDIVYRTLTLRGGKRGEDHFTSALLCGTLAYYLNNEFIVNRPTKRKLVSASWLV